MITIRSVEGTYDYLLVIDGTVFTTEQALVDLIPDFTDPDRLNFSISALNQEAMTCLFGQTFADIPPDVYQVKLEEPDSDKQQNAAISVYTHIFNLPEKNRLELNFNGYINALAWKEGWSIEEYTSKFSDTFRAKAISGASLRMNAKSASSAGFNMTFTLTNPRALIGDKVSECARALEEVFDSTKSFLDEELTKNSVVVHFDFPAEVKVACEQYLLYFVQFLEDVGLGATAELRHEAGQVLFAVTPTDKNEALDKIHEALKTYLSLAASPVNTASVLSTEIEVQRLSANIQHLQGQLTLAHAVLQAKDATIQLQQTTIDRQRQVIGGEIILESMKDVTPKPKDSEEVLGGLAEITKYEGKGFNLNLPEAFRRLRQMFSEKKGEKK